MYIEGSGSSTPRCHVVAHRNAPRAPYRGPVSDIVWSPTAEYVERANVTRFMRAHGIETYEELVERSVQDISWFWDAVVRDLGIEFLEPYGQVLDVSRGVEWATWFGGGRINVAHQCVDRWSAATPDAPAVVWEGEDGDTRTWTYAELRRQTDRLARALLGLGVERGDAVGIFLPMLPETVAAVMACSKIGAIWVPIFSGFGPDAVAVRLEDAGVSVLLTADAFPRKGRAVPMLDAVRGALARVDSVRETVVLRHAGEGAAAGERDWASLVEAESDAPLASEPLESEHPLFIGYTSGTTGTPKGVLHVHGGFLVKIASEVAYQVDLHQGEVLHWVTDLGWIMGPWQIVGGAGARLDRVPLRRRADPPGARSPLVARRAARDHHARRLPDPDPSGRSRPGPDTCSGTICPRSGSSRRPGSRGTPTRTCGCIGRSAPPRSRSST